MFLKLQFRQHQRQHMARWQLLLQLPQQRMMMRTRTRRLPWSKKKTSSCLPSVSPWLIWPALALGSFTWSGWLLEQPSPFPCTSGIVKMKNLRIKNVWRNYNCSLLCRSFCFILWRWLISTNLWIMLYHCYRFTILNWGRMENNDFQTFAGKLLTQWPTSNIDQIHLPKIERYDVTFFFANRLNLFSQDLGSGSCNATIYWFAILIVLLEYLLIFTLAIWFTIDVLFVWRKKAILITPAARNLQVWTEINLWMLQYCPWENVHQSLPWHQPVSHLTQKFTSEQVESYLQLKEE